MHSFWHSAPFVRLVIPFALGIVIGSFPVVRSVSHLFPLLLAGLLFLYAMVYRNRWKEYANRVQFGAIVTAVFMLLGMAAVLSRVDSRIAHFEKFNGDVSFLAEVETIPVSREKSVRFEMRIHGFTDSLLTFHHYDKSIMAYAPLDAGADTLVLGDLIVFADIPSGLEPPLNPGQFDYGSYLFNRGFAGTLYMQHPFLVVRPVQKEINLVHFFQTWREKAINIFREHNFAPRELGVVSALVLGKRELVDPDTRSAYADAGTVHILAVSGLHVGIIYLFIAFVLGKVLRGKKFKLVILLITLLLLWTYAGITGFSPSVLRAATMFSFIAIGRHSGQFGSIYNMLGVSAFVLLLINPFLIKEVGFQLSYLAVIGIVYLHPKIFPLLATGNWLWDKIWALAVVSFSAQLATFPLSIYYFNQFPNYFLITNLMVIPLATIILYLGILTLLGAWIPLLGSVLAFLLRMAAEVLNEVILFSSALPFAVSKGLYFSSVSTILVYVIIVFLIRTYKDPRHGNLKILLTSVTVLVLMHSVSVVRRTNTSSITCFHVNGHTAIAATNGRHVHIWTDLYPNQLDKLKFSMEGYLNQVRPVKVTYSAANETFEGNGIASKEHMIGCGPLTVLLVNDSFPKRASFDQEVDAILVSGKISPESFPSYAQEYKPMIALDGSVPYYRRRKLIAMADSSASRFWATSEEGALTLSRIKGF